MIRIRNLRLLPGQPEQELIALAAKALRLKPEELQALTIFRRSIDARKKSDVRVVYTVDVAARGEAALLRRFGGPNISKAVHTPYVLPKTGRLPALRPVVVGFGPAGIFAALILAEAGLRPIVLERGQDAETRRRKVSEFWETGRLDPECNVQFGEGGAGTFSDGKLNTGVNDHRIAWVLAQFRDAGADPAICYDAKPHIGTDVLVTVVQNLRRRIEVLGGEVRFGVRVTGLCTENGALTGLDTTSGHLDCNAAILAIGHSARDTFTMLHETGISMAPKAFSMGVRIEHRQAAVNHTQYGAFAGRLPAADYKLSSRFADGSSAYTFCMCPGGYVVAAASEPGRVVTNGMSCHARDGENANSALLVTLTPDQFPDKSMLGGMAWQRQIEAAAFAAGGGSYRAPAQLVGDFLSGRASTEARSVTPTYRPGVTFCDLRAVLPAVITDTLAQAIPALDRKLPGFADPDAVLTAPETRSSSPVRILRDDSLQSELRGLFPCGEGAGYAGGITSAAVDGIKCAEALVQAL